MSEIKEIGDNEVRIVIDSFKGVDRSKHPTKLDIDEFELMENFVRTKQSGGGSLSKRRGIQVYNSNVLTTNKPVRNIFEAKLDSQYYMLGKDADGSATSDLKYNAIASGEYQTAWDGDVSIAEYESYYRFLAYKNGVYICNRVGSSLEENKVWRPSDLATTLYTHGCLPPSYDATRPVFTPSTTGGLTVSSYYWYVVTFVYDGYQESGAFDAWFGKTGNTDGTMTISFIPNGSARVKSKKIYRSTAQADLFGMPEYFHYLGTVGASDTTYKDVLEDTALGEAIPATELFELYKPYRAKHQIQLRDRLVQGNVAVDSTTYTAMDSADPVVVDASNSRGSGVSGGTYKYRFYKAYAQHSGGRYVYLLGNYVEKSVVATAGHAINIDLANGAEVLLNQWCERILIMRTTVGGSDFYVMPYRHISGAFLEEPMVTWHKKTIQISTLQDATTDSELVAFNQSLKADLIYSAGQDSSAEIVPQSTAYKGTLAYSEVGQPDKVRGNSLKQLRLSDSIGITGLFAEDARAVIFTSNQIHVLNTDTQSPEYWQSDLAIDGIGAMGQPTAPNTEGAGHNGIIQLPEGTGYLFFNRAYATTGQQIKVFYWNGQSYPEEISIPIDAYFNDGFSSFNIRGMAYDKINNWVWTVVAYGSGVKKIFIFDLVYKQWYVWQVNNTVEMNDIICLESGTIVIGAGDGRLLYYHPSLYYETYGATPTIYYYTTKLRTKTFEQPDADFIFKRLVVNCESSSNTTTFSTTSGDTTLTTEVAGATTVNNLVVANSASTTWHRIRVDMNLKTRKAYLQLTDIQTKGITINSIVLDAKLKHKRDASR